MNKDDGARREDRNGRVIDTETDPSIIDDMIGAAEEVTERVYALIERQDAAWAALDAAHASVDAASNDLRLVRTQRLASPDDDALMGQEQAAAARLNTTVKAQHHVNYVFNATAAEVAAASAQVLLSQAKHQLFILRQIKSKVTRKSERESEGED